MADTIDAFSVFLGMNAKLYVNGEEYANVKDVTMNFSRATADVTTRANDGWRANVGTLREATASFQMVRYSTEGDDVVSDPAVILNAFLANGEGSLIKAAILDAAPSQGGQGVYGFWSVTSCNRNEALEDAVTYDVELSLTKFVGWYGGSGDAVDGYIPAA